MGEPFLSIRSLYVSRGGRALYHDFSLDASAMQTTCLIAPSGAGKTTLLDFIAGILPGEETEASGTVLFDGREERPRMSFLFQEPRLIAQATVLQNVMLPLVNVMTVREAEASAERFLSMVHLEQRARALPGGLSGGERQRVSMARSFAYPSPLLLMDEPFQSQDLRIKKTLISILSDLLRKERRTALFVTHDAEEAALLSDRIILLDGSPLSIKADITADGQSTAETVQKITSLVVQDEKLDYNGTNT